MIRGWMFGCGWDEPLVSVDPSGAIYASMLSSAADEAENGLAENRSRVVADVYRAIHSEMHPAVKYRVTEGVWAPAYGAGIAGEMFTMIADPTHPTATA